MSKQNAETNETQQPLHEIKEVEIDDDDMPEYEFADEDGEEEDGFVNFMVTSDGETVPDVLKGIQVSLDNLCSVLEKQGRILFKLTNQLPSVVGGK